MTVFSAATLLFLVMDPFGNIPIFLSILEPYSAARRLRIIARELLIALAVLMTFLFAGQYILAALHISESSLTAAGGVILFLIALRMIFPKAGGVMEHGAGDDGGEPLVVPLAIPLIAGPSAMASVMFIMSSDPSRAPIWAGAVFLAWLLTGTVLMLAVRFSRWLGRRGLTAIQRLMGMILTAIAINMMMTGIREFFAL